MLFAMGRISGGREPGTPATHGVSSDSVMRQASSSEMPRSRGARAAADSGCRRSRTQLLFEEFFHPLHALFVLDLGQRILHRIDGVKIGKINPLGLIGIFGVIEDVLFLGRAVVDECPFPCRSAPETGTSVRTPISRQTSTISDHMREIQGATAPCSRVSGLVGHQGVQVHRAHDAGAAAGAAGPLLLKASSSAPGA